MSTFKVQLGDLSGDGHGITEEYTVEVPDTLSHDRLRANYIDNVGIFGFSPEDLAPNWDGGQITAKQVSSLVGNGFSPAHFDEPIDSDPLSYSSQDEYESRLMYFREGPQTLLEICMFFVGYGISEFEWHEIQDKTPLLFGSGRGAFNSRSIGANLFGG